MAPQRTSRGRLCGPGEPNTGRRERESRREPGEHDPARCADALIAEASEIDEAALALIEELRPDEGAGLGQLETTVVRLPLVAASTYSSGLVCLWMPQTS